jgi:iron(III) transport system permease protein
VTAVGSVRDTSVGPVLDPLGAVAPDRRRGPSAPGWLSTTAVAVAVMFAAPLAYLVIRTVGLGSTAWDVLTSDDARGPLLRTVTLAVAVSVPCAVIGTTCAWLTTRTDLPGRSIWRIVLALPLVIPSYVGALALIAAFAPGGIIDELVGFATPPRVRGFGGSVFVLVLLSYPYVYLPVAARLASLPPQLEESARALGRRPGAVFRTVVLPQSWGAIAGGTLLVFLYAVSEFGAVSLMRYDTLTLRIEATRLFDRDTSITLSLLLAVVALAVVATERATVRRRAGIEAVGAGRRSLQHPLGPWRVPALCFTGIIATLSLATPVVVIGQWAWRGFSGRSRFGGPGVALSELATPLVNTASIAVIAALVTVTAVMPIAYLTARYRSRIGDTVNAVVVGGFALPGLVVALALVYWVLQAPGFDRLYQSYPLLVFAYAVHFGAQGLRASQEAVAGLPRRVDDAARSLGAGRTRRFLTLDLPLMRPGLAAAVGLVLLACMKELPATLLVAPIGFETLAIRIWSAAENGFLARAGLASLALIGVSAVLTWLLTIRRLDRLT